MMMIFNRRLVYISINQKQLDLIKNFEFIDNRLGECLNIESVDDFYYIYVFADGTVFCGKEIIGTITEIKNDINIKVCDFNSCEIINKKAYKNEDLFKFIANIPLDSSEYYRLKIHPYKLDEFTAYLVRSEK